mgnify:CR=1 FL=1
MLVLVAGMVRQLCAGHRGVDVPVFTLGSMVNGAGAIMFPGRFGPLSGIEVTS